MKRRILITAVVIGILAGLVYIVPIVVSSANARPLHGDYDMGMKCMGGHEIFLHLESEAAYDRCPGHRDKNLIGRVIRDGSSLTILDKDEEPFIRVEQEDSDLMMELIARPKGASIFQYVRKRKIEQVSNPWRTWLPRFLPED